MSDRVAYLKGLDEEIWSVHLVREFFNGRMSQREHYRVKRPLTHEEWKTVLETVEQEGLALALQSSNFGFSIGLRIVKGPDYPGLDCEDLLSLSSDHFPFPDGQRKFDFLWDVLTPLTHSEKNLAKLKFLGIDMRLSKGDWAY